MAPQRLTAAGVLAAFVAVLAVVALPGVVTATVAAGDTQQVTADRGGTHASLQSDEFEIVALDPSGVQLDEPRDVTITVTVANRADRNRSAVEPVELRINGRTVTSNVLSLRNGEQTDIQLTIPADELGHGGQYIFSVWTEGDAKTGTVQVAGTPTPAQTPPPEDPTPADATPTPQVTDTPAETATPNADGSGPGFGLLTVVGALVVVLAVAGRRWTA